MLIVTREHNVVQADVSAAQHALSASVIVANDIPMLHTMEAYQDATCHKMSVLRHFRLDTVEDDQSMPASLQLPHSQGKKRLHAVSILGNHFRSAALERLYNAKLQGTCMLTAAPTHAEQVSI